MSPSARTDGANKTLAAAAAAAKNPCDTPKRPLCSYNLFFQRVRERFCSGPHRSRQLGTRTRTNRPHSWGLTDQLLLTIFALSFASMFSVVRIHIDIVDTASPYYLAAQLLERAAATGPTPTSFSSTSATNTFRYHLDANPGGQRSWADHHFRDVGIALTNQTFPPLPTNRDIEEMYGIEPTIVGMEPTIVGRGPTSQCAALSLKVPSEERRWIGVAGLFNTGTNLLYKLLSKNCRMPTGTGDGNEDKEKKGSVHWQVPWGKHEYASNFENRTAPGYGGIDRQQGLVVVMTRSPYDWSMSMCRHPYIVRWAESSKDSENKALRSCPNLKSEVNIWGTHKNLMHFWNVWYRKYAHDFPNPRIMVRVEDLILRPQETVESICSCAGGNIAKKFQHVVESTKIRGGHGTKEEVNGMINAWKNIHLPRQMKSGLSAEDCHIAKESLDGELMNLFQYKHPSLQ